MSEVKNTRTYDKMDEYISAVFEIFKMIHNKSVQQNDNKLKMISLTIYNYILFMSKSHNIDLKKIELKDSINMIPVFEYISYNNIELYDFTKIKLEDLDVNKKEDLERFVLTHIYYITQSNTFS
jgi:hypothetical protein